ncbi:Z1 domain-containing protein [Persicitalea sp.]|uniref:Z1 domain-containing protein n=1 Tax=Persicitalea sp. TaxID=3100273 RepID=UPI00359394FE
MNADLVKNWASSRLAGETERSEAIIREVVDQILELAPAVKPEREAIIRYLSANFSVSQDAYQILDNPKNKPKAWVKSERASNNLTWEFWERYKYFLQPKLPAPTLNNLDDLTDSILDRLVNPKTSGSWDRRGMVVGQVQSGKTGNYIGLINKAADAGYKFIIVLAGLHDTLRTQTQIRIDEGFLGFNPTKLSLSSNKANYLIGVGKYNRKLIAHALTTSVGDFGKPLAERSGFSIHSSDPIILVVKKNAGILKNLVKWLAIRAETRDDKKLIENTPVLIIDDEADNASINTSKHLVSTINGLIRSLLSLFEQSAYVGYTATPFANIFIPIEPEEIIKGLNIKISNFEYKVGEDLFPRDFIINIPAPSNYIGPAKIFGLSAVASSERAEEPLPVLVNLNDQTTGFKDDYRHFVPDKHKKYDPLPEQIPTSLDYAIKCFLLVCAARRARGQNNQHNSMLIHISRFVPWIDRTASLVYATLKNYQNQIEFETKDKLLTELESIWQKDFMPTTAGIIESQEADLNGFKDTEITQVDWIHIKENLFAAAMLIEVRAVHGQKKTIGLEYTNIKTLDYFDAEQENPPRFISVIAVGGDKLSRGLTLEGLSISYYLRASKMYDTLMQMGRWFGYRPGYVDLCRLFTSSELIGWYKHITIASEEIREEFDQMVRLNKTPAEFGFKVRTHPGVLTITAVNKFRDARTMWLSYSGQLVQTRRFKIEENLFRHNLAATEQFLNQLGSTVTPLNKKSARRFNKVWETDSFTICQFLSEYHIESAVMNTSKITEYIDKQSANGKYLTKWTVVLINNSQAKEEDKWPFFINNNSEKVGLTNRGNASSDWQSFYEISKAQLLSPPSGDEYIDLTEEQLADSEKKTEEDWKKKGNEDSPKYPSTFRIKYSRPSSQGLLLIYPLNPVVKLSGNKVEGKPLHTIISPVPVIGLAVSFPNIEHDEKIEYAVNQQFIEDFDFEYTPEMDNE